MKSFIAFIKKEFYHIFRDRRTILILLVMPAVQIILFGFAITTEVKNTNIAIYDPSNDAVTTRMVEQLEASDYFTVNQLLTNSAQINEVFRTGAASLVIVFGSDFGNNLYRTGEAVIQIISDGTDPNQAQMLTNYATAILSSFQTTLSSSSSSSSVTATSSSSTSSAASYQIVPEIHMLYNPQQKSAFNFVPGVMGMVLMLICAMMSSIAIVREREMGTMEVLLTSPIKPIYIILAKAVPYFSLSVFNLTTILLLSVYVLGVPIAGNLWALIGVSLIFILLSLSLGLLISTFVDTQMAAMLASGMLLMMPVMLLSGMMFPIESMPPILQYVSACVPARWYVEAVKKLMIQGVELTFVVKEIVILSLITLGLLFISLKKFKNRLC